MSTHIILTSSEREVLEYIRLNEPHIEQSKIIEHFYLRGKYNTQDSARNTIGVLLKRLFVYELIERVATTDSAFKKNSNVWRLAKNNNKVKMDVDLDNTLSETTKRQVAELDERVAELKKNNGTI